MDKQKIKLQAPIEVEIKVSIVRDDGQQGTATLGMPFGRYPTETELRASVQKFVEVDMPDGFRLMTKREWFNANFGQAQEMDEDGDIRRINFSIPGGDAWDA